jgi:hypothetical protein
VYCGVFSDNLSLQHLTDKPLAKILVTASQWCLSRALEILPNLRSIQVFGESPCDSCYAPAAFPGVSITCAPGSSSPAVPAAPVVPPVPVAPGPPGPSGGGLRSPSHYPGWAADTAGIVIGALEMVMTILVAVVLIIRYLRARNGDYTRQAAGLRMSDLRCKYIFIFIFAKTNANLSRNRFF